MTEQTALERAEAMTDREAKMFLAYLAGREPLLVAAVLHDYDRSVPPDIR